MSRWIDNSLADKLYMVNHVSDAKNIDPESVEKDSKLYHEIVEHRQKYYHVGGVDYALDLPKQIVFCPTGEVRERLRADYENMRSSFIYGEALAFDALMRRIEEFQERFHLVKY